MYVCRPARTACMIVCLLKSSARNISSQGSLAQCILTISGPRLYFIISSFRMESLCFYQLLGGIQAKVWWTNTRKIHYLHIILIASFHSNGFQYVAIFRKLYLKKCQTLLGCYRMKWVITRNMHYNYKYKYMYIALMSWIGKIHVPRPQKIPHGHETCTWNPELNHFLQTSPCPNIQPIYICLAS